MQGEVERLEEALVSFTPMMGEQQIKSKGAGEPTGTTNSRFLKADISELRGRERRELVNAQRGYKAGDQRIRTIEFNSSSSKTGPSLTNMSERNEP